jgi:hypothetical protein
VRYLFLVGCQRSGTTWLGWLLAQHPETVVSLHTGFFRHLDHMFDWLRRPTMFGNRVLGAGGPETRREVSGNAVPINDLVSEPRLFAACRPLAEELYRQVSAPNPAATLVVEKTPEHLLNAEMIRLVLPEARFLHVVRDPRGVYASMRSAVKQWAYPGDFPTDPQTFVRRRWSRYLDAWDRLDPQGEQFSLIRYEDLLADTPGELGRLYEWLDLPADRALCERAVEACSLDRLRKDSAAPEGFFRSGRAEGWRDELPAGDVRVIEHLARDRMEELGYRCMTPPAGRAPLGLRLADARASALQRLAAGPLRRPAQMLVAKLRLRRDWQR